MEERRLQYERDYFVYLCHFSFEFCATVYHVQKNQIVDVLHVTSKS